MEKQEIPQEFWDELSLKLRRMNAHMKSLPKPARTMEERRVTKLLADKRKEDAKIKRRNPVSGQTIDRRKGKVRRQFDDEPMSDFMIKQKALDEEKANSPEYKAIVASRMTDFDPIASSEEE